MFTIDPAQPDDLPFLWDMLWAAAVAEEVRALGWSAGFALPDVHHYLAGWGRPGDAGVVARDETGRRLGAAWYRLFPAEDPGYGFVAPDVPELAIGVVSAARSRGVGGALLDALAATARTRGFRALSLSVDRRNPARRLYERTGFRDAGTFDPTETGVTMLLAL